MCWTCFCYFNNKIVCKYSYLLRCLKVCLLLLTKTMGKNKVKYGRKTFLFYKEKERTAEDFQSNQALFQDRKFNKI